MLIPLFVRRDVLCCLSSEGLQPSHVFLSLHRLVSPQTDLQLNGGQLRVTWQFYEEVFMWRDASRGRNFSTDRTYFDHYILAPSQVGCVVVGIFIVGYKPHIHE